jgi:hypothetical protein
MEWKLGAHLFSLLRGISRLRKCGFVSIVTMSSFLGVLPTFQRNASLLPLSAERTLITSYKITQGHIPGDHNFIKVTVLIQLSSVVLLWLHNSPRVNFEVYMWKLKITNFFDIIHRISLTKNAHDVSETGVCLRHQVKDIYSVGPNRWS